MRGSRYFIVLVASLIFVLGLIRVAPVQAPYVKIYVVQPLGYIPPPAGPYPVYYFQVEIYIETSGIPDTAAGGIIGWAMNIQFNPDVHDLTYGMAFTGAGYSMYEFAKATRGVDFPQFIKGTLYPTTGYWYDMVEMIPSSPTKGAGDATFATWPLLVTLEFDCLTEGPSLIDLMDVEYRLTDGTWHAAEIVEDGFYGQPHVFMSEVADPFDPMNPVGSVWHELYPNYCRLYDLVGWTDNFDLGLSASDQVTMVNETGWIYQYHVDKVTTTIHFTFKSGPEWPADSTGELGDAEPVEPHMLEDPMTNPIGSTWHMIYPDYSREFEITSFEDNGNGVFDESDQFDFEFFDEPGIQWAHLDSVTTDIILSQKGDPDPPEPEFPLGLEIMMVLAAAIPIVYVWRTRKWGGKK